LDVGQSTNRRHDPFPAELLQNSAQIDLSRISLVLAFPLGFQASDMTTYRSWLCRDADIWTLLSHWQHDVFGIRKLLICPRRPYAI
jgi:hypothetical protein